MNVTLTNTIKWLSLTSLVACSGKGIRQAEESRPNIILIMADDIGYSDIGCYGSEIATPNLNFLGENGIRFRTFYNSAKSNPSRSNLLTGLYYGDEKAVNVASILRQNGYYTMHSGKEHFDGWVPKHCYAVNSFDTSFYYWTINQFLIPSDGKFQNPFYLHGRKLSIEELQGRNKVFYKTDCETDFAIHFLNSAHQKKKPFFLYLPYNAAHFPLQAMPEDINKYRGKYMVGWDSLRLQRYQRMCSSGLLKDNYRLSAPTSNINKYRGGPKGNSDIRSKIPLYRPWNTLSEKEKHDLDLEMSVYAAMIDRMDQNIGRIIQWLKENDQYENTLILFLIDNGSCPYDSNIDFDHSPGSADSYRTLCAAWANVGNTPFKYFKQFGHEGGCNTPFIAHWPKIIKKGFFTDQVGHITDIFPTLLDIAGVEYPATFNDIPTISLHGKSLSPIFKGQEREAPEFFMSGYTEKFRMFRKGDWKIVRSNGEEWELYLLSEDPSEIKNMAADHPEKLNEMIQSYIEQEKRLQNKNL